jgi:predicted Zn finger-like uncharacterized protein
MILTCPNCETQYVVKDGAIPAQGRQVRCASCKHSWHQDPEAAEELQMGPEMQPAESDPADQSFAEAAIIEPSTGPEAEERAYEEAAIEEQVAAGDHLAESSAQGSVGFDETENISEATPVAAADYDGPPEPEAHLYDEFSPFAERESVEVRRRSGLLTILLVLAAVVALAAAFWFFAPSEWKARLGLAEAAATPLELSNPPHVERVPLASGNELLTVAGRVINPTDQTHNVPPIYAELRNHAGKVIYRWTIAPPAPSLGPGASASFNSAEVNVPAGGEDLTISLGQPKA